MPALSLTRQSSILAMLLLFAIVTLNLVRTMLGSEGVDIGFGQGLAAAILLIAAGVVTNRLAVNIGLFNDFCSLPLSLYAIIACGVNPATATLSSAAVGVMTAIALHLFIRTLHHTNNKEFPLFGGILLGAMPLIYTPTIIFAPLMLLWAWIAQLNLRQTIIATAGYLLPIASVSYVVWYMGEPFSSIANGLYQELVTPTNLFAIERVPIIPTLMATVVALLSIAGIILLYAQRNALFVRSRKGVLMTIITLVASVAMVWIPSADMTIVAVAAVPAAVLVAAMLNRSNRNIADTLYLILLLLMVTKLLLGGW